MPRTDVSNIVEDVVGRFAALVRHVASRCRLNESDVEELLQELRIRLWRASQRGEQIERLPTSYVYRTAMSAALDMVRRRRAQREDVSTPLESHYDMPIANAGPENDAAEAELVREVASAILTIPESRRPVVRMYLAGYPRDEIADVLGWSEAKVRNLLYRGLADLRACLAEKGIGLEQTL